jgi:microcystin-dependent protein
MVGEIKLFAYEDIPDRWIACKGQTLNINEYRLLYMLIGKKFGNADDCSFCLPNLQDITPKHMTYCIALEGDLPKLSRTDS